ncbi:hypothetical protein DCAR_0103674 [Daucus carota subsp. sativus]|uniref:Uncharacterized protein n=1 Tax=Daucus carota subsp. sativus TaxID=79200 RepID=A0AAF0WAL7_DAUCS|nr:hypothetical protein DCAR_0103674 [Daucus carota subsp. sativus]
MCYTMRGPNCFRISGSGSKLVYINAKKCILQNGKIGRYHLTTSSPNSRPCSLLPPKNQHLFVANQRLHSKKWAVGVLFFFILPSYRLRMGPFAILKDKVDEMFETAETAAAVVEDLAELVDRLAEEAEKKLPDGTKLDDLARSIENLAERVDEKAEQAQELIKEVALVTLIIYLFSIKACIVQMQTEILAY